MTYAATVISPSRRSAVAGNSSGRKDAGTRTVFERLRGVLPAVDHTSGEGADADHALDSPCGPLLALTSSWRDVQQTRLAITQRGQEDFAALLQTVETKLVTRIKGELRDHAVWPWLSQYSGLGGVQTARLIAMIGDPHRFPGAVCVAGHHHAVRAGVPSALGQNNGPCGVTLADESICDEQIGSVRPGTGTRHLWAYLGLAPGQDGKLPKRKRGVQANWNPEGRTVCLMPTGIADQIVRARTPVYRDIYDAAKLRLTEERGAADGLVIDNNAGPALRPIEVDKRARIIAVKAFTGDLLAEMKRVTS